MVINLFFSRKISRVILVVERIPGRSFLLGLVNSLFIAAIILGIVALADRSGIEIIAVIAVVLLGFFICVLSLGLTSMSRIIGERMFPKLDPVRQIITGSIILTLACLTPFLGWFGVFPYLGFVGVGGFISTLISKNRV
jgi:hypothetical protein